ncbi:hypothetical protein NE236_39910 [Actinoallomurus purpureus]|uniref:hypothetical protein n=1 Tax=Actinoallomurus purpureus TaxID=478114 RepID=UPI0020937BFF|nr:hypothetical protein [Actinoallomurus purpureus]MCO6011140.1 hypothetical protein [Actinoallomurus purpureus]
MGEETITSSVVRHLHELRGALDQAGFETTLDHTYGAAPYLRATNRHAPVMSETIRCEHHIVDGDAYWFFYSWGQPICPAADKGLAAREISRVIGNR